jgi:hypothetical protein
VVLDEAWVRRTIITLPLLTGSVRGIQTGLELLVGIHRSVGYISQTLQQAGQAAAAYQARLTVPVPILGEADEIFQGRQPCLTVVDGRSFLVLHLAPAEARDATTWGVTLLDLHDRGVRFHDLVSDEAQGIRAGVREARLAIPLRPDLFHLLQAASTLTRRLERAAYRAIEQAERARRAETEAHTPTRRRGAPLKVPVPREEAEAQEAQALTTYDLWTWLLRELRQALEPLTPDGRLQTTPAARATVQTAAELLLLLAHPDVTPFAQHLLAQVDALIAPLAWLEQTLAPWREGLEAPTETVIVWAWQHRQALNLAPGEGFPPPLQPIVQAIWAGLALFHRASSLAEALHSWLRPYLQMHRGRPRWLFPLLQLFWNHHTFQRGKRAGHSPLELAGITNAPSLVEVLERLLPPPSPGPAGAVPSRAAA